MVVRGDRANLWLNAWPDRAASDVGFSMPFAQDALAKEVKRCAALGCAASVLSGTSDHVGDCRRGAGESDNQPAALQ